MPFVIKPHDPKKRSAHIYSVSSKSNRTKSYHIYLDLSKSENIQSLAIWCDCPSWKFCKDDPKTCKHIDKTWKDIVNNPDECLRKPDPFASSVDCTLTGCGGKSIEQIVGWNLSDMGIFLTPLSSKTPVHLTKGKSFICPCGAIVIVKGRTGRCGCGKRLIG